MATSLPSLPATERLSARCIRILGGNPGKFTLQGTNTYLLGTGPRRILVDTGEGREPWIRALRQILEEEQALVETVILTHWHHDHVGGVDDVMELYSSGGPFESLAHKPDVFKNTPGPGQRPLEDGDVFSVDGATLTAIHAPGHTSDHIVLRLAEEDALLTADAVLGHGTAVFEDLAKYLTTLQRMRSVFNGRAYPGHGALIEDGPAKIAEYIEHRKQREDQVLKSLMSGGDPSANGGEPQVRTALDLVEMIYTETPKELHLAAMRGVVQILQKLEGEGRVQRRGDDSWQLRTRSTL